MELQADDHPVMKQGRRKAEALTAMQVECLTKVGYHFVGGVDGLILQIQSSGARSWIHRVRMGGKRREIGVGAYPEVSVEAARERVRRQKELIRQGVDPVAHKRGLQGMTAFNWIASAMACGVPEARRGVDGQRGNVLYGQ